MLWSFCRRRKRYNAFSATINDYYGTWVIRRLLEGAA